MGGEELPGVSRTAVWVAGMRAAESERADRLFDDRLAAAFVSAAGGGIVPQTAGPPGTSEFLAVRARFFDDQARAACGAGIRQIVLPAAGLDCRAFRLDWPSGVRLFELDLPEMFAFKEPVLASVEAVARCVRVVVAVDLRGQWAQPLIDAGFDPGAPTAWLAEGLLPYLQRADGERLLATVTELSAPGSRAVFDHLETTAAERPGMRAVSEVVRQVGAQLMPTADSPADWLTGHGWQARLFRLPALAEEYGRSLPADVDLVASNAVVVITADR
ncbi:SAM-dependent methyltransferase [Streptosporangiaceae bacterium NEAU-GS5]|nr:SAM-dependent methyltransferase [Streptosporangiaceae bacterium NEAU-GS5]